MDHRKYLRDDSPLRRGCKTPKPPITHFTNWYALEYEIEAGVRERQKSGLNKIPILVELPYYDSLLIQNLGDPMHQEGNMAKNLFRHIFGQMDEMRHRKACEEFNVHPSAWVYYKADGTKGKRPAPWVLTRAKRDTF
ncbi:hypothetical protein R1sor_007759 [Riccia sorocarpa]|uniref:Uncharacterized protein n=1 Tax=Riccia sorocarpa TaxID=122646 RepID=A0ABD3HRN8_9MARC